MIRIETDPQACRSLWDQFSPQRHAWDDWDLMYAFHDQDRHNFHFLVHEENAQANGMIPLVFDTTQDRYMLMAGSYPDGRDLWIRDQDFAEFVEQFPNRTVLFDLKQGCADELLRHHPQLAGHFAEQDHRYLLTPAEFDFDFQKHLDLLGRDKKQKFLYDLRNIRKREPELHWSGDNEADLFIELVNRNFGAESDYANPDDAKEVRRVIGELESSARLKTLTIAIDGQRQAVSMSLLQGNKMVALYASSNNDFNNLGKLLNVETIQEACRLRVEEISFMTGMQWKANWKMQSELCCTFRKPPAPWPTP